MTADGGESILQELEYAENSTYKRYTGYELLDIRPSVVFDVAKFDWKQVSVAVSISGREMMQNSGRSKMIDLISSRIKNAEKTMMNGLSEDLYSSGTADGGKQITGVQAAISKTPTSGTYGGINRANHSFWRNEAQTAASLAAAKVKERWQAMWVQLIRGTDKPDLIVCDNTVYAKYWAELTDLQRFTSPDEARSGFTRLKFDSADVVLDGGHGGSCPVRTAYFKNCDYIHWRPHTRRNMVSLNPKRYATNQDAEVQLMGWMGNLTTSNASLQGVDSYTAA